MGNQDELTRAFGLRLRSLRESKRWTQELLAERARLHRTYVGGIERGLRNPTLRNIAKLATALGVPISDLFAGFDVSVGRSQDQ